MASLAALAAEEVMHARVRPLSARSSRSIAASCNATSALPPLHHAPDSSRMGEQYTRTTRKRSTCLDLSEAGLNDHSRNSDHIATAPEFFNNGRPGSSKSTTSTGDLDSGTPWTAANTARSHSKANNAAISSKTSGEIANNGPGLSDSHRPQSAHPRPKSAYVRSQNVWDRPESGIATASSNLTHRTVSRRGSSVVTWSSCSSTRCTSRTGREAWDPEQEHRLNSYLQAQAAGLRDSEDPQGQQHRASEVAKWDRLSLRQWFNKIDKDRSGSISKQEWFNFIRRNPKFRQTLLNLTGEPVADRFSTASLQRGRAEATEIKRLMKTIKALDVDNSGTLDFEEFLEVFRRTGHLIEYRSETNPREEMASILGDIQDGKDAVGNGAVHQLVSLARDNLTGKQSRDVERKALQVAPVQKLTPQCVKGQSVPPLHKVTSCWRDNAL